MDHDRRTNAMARKCPCAILVLACLLGIGLPRCEAGEASLTFSVSGALAQELSLAELQAQLGGRAVEYHDPFAAKTKHYEAFAIGDVMELAYGERWRDPAYTEVVFKAFDGYQAVAAVVKLQEEGRYLAFRDLDIAEWEPIGQRKANPGPFYLFWTGPDQTPAHEYPWPWQIASIGILRFEEHYPEVLPASVSHNSPAYRGYLIFKGQCVRCHSMNRQGGKIGPDLNAPRSIVSYRSKQMIKEFIRHPSTFRYTYMPDHLHLTERELEDLYQYFRVKNRELRKVEPTRGRP